MGDWRKSTIYKWQAYILLVDDSKNGLPSKKNGPSNDQSIMHFICVFIFYRRDQHGHSNYTSEFTRSNSTTFKPLVKSKRK